MATRVPAPVDTGVTPVVTRPVDRAPAPVPPGPGTTGQIPTARTPVGPPEAAAPAVTPSAGITVPPVATPQGPPETVPPAVTPGPGTGQSASATVAPTVPVQELPVDTPNVEAGITIIPTINYIQVLANGTVVVAKTTAMNFAGTGVTVTGSNGTATITISGGNGSSYGDSNVVTLLSSFGSNTVSTTGNVTGGYILGNGSLLTGIAASYGNANVVANLAALGSNPVSTTGNVTSGNVITSAQVIATGVIQSGTGLSTGGYLSVNGTTDLHDTTVTGNLSATGNVTIPGNIVGTSTIVIDNRATGNGADIQLYSADDILLQARDRSAGSTSEGGDINIYAGDSAEDSDSSGGDIEIFAGNGGAANIDFGGSGGFVTIQSGQGGAASTGVDNYGARPGGALTLRAGDGGTNNGNIDRGAAGGNVIIEAGDSTGNGINGGTIYLTSGAADASGLAGNVVIQAGGTWTFGSTGNLTAPGNISAVGNITGNYILGNGSQLTGLPATYGNANVVANLAALGSNPVSTTGNITGGNILGGANVNATTHTGTTVSVSANVTGGNFLTAGLISATGNITGGNLSAVNLVINNITSDDSTLVSVQDGLQVYGNITADNLGNVAAINLDGNVSNVLSGTGTWITAGGGGANTGNVTFNDVNIIGTGNLNLQPNGSSSEYLNIYLTGAADIHVAAGGGSGNVILGTDEEANVAVLLDGNVAIQAGNVSGTKTWNFDTAGNLTLPLGGIVYETNIPDQGLSGSAIALKPPGGTTANQQLLIYPTANDGDHIHLTSGNLYTTELFLGSDNLYVKLANTGNVVINSNNGNSSNAMWTFGTDGSLTLPIGVSIDYNGNVEYPKIIADSGKLFSVQGQGNSGAATLAWTVNPNAASQYAAVSVNRAGDNLAKVVLQAQSDSGNAATVKLWKFDETGTLTAPGQITAPSLITNSIRSDDSSFVNIEDGVNITGAVVASGNIAGNYFVGNGSQLTGISAGANTGNVTFNNQIVLGTGTNDGGGGLYLAPGNASIANSAVQYFRVRGGDVPTHIHLDTGNNDYYDQYFGDDAQYVKLANTGNVVIGTDDANGNQYNWSFTSDGNLILAGGNSVIQSIANSSSEPLYPNVSTMVFTPDAFLSSQSLVLDPTGPSHIHLRAPGANIDEPDANIFLGGEESSFEVGYYNGNVPNLYIHSNNNTWTFDTAGILAFPRDTSNISTDPILTITGGASPKILSEDASLAGPANLEITALNTIFTGSSGSAIKIYPDDGEVASDGNLQIWANSGGNTEYSWTFDTTGNLTTPSNLVIGPGPGSGSSIFQYNEGLQILGEGANSVVQLGWTANTSAPDSVTTIAMNYPNGGEGNVLIAVGNNATTVNYWLFDNTGNLRLPGNTFAVNYANGTAVSLGGSSYGNANVVANLAALGSNPVSTTGNVTGGNLITSAAISAASVSASGNITGGNFVGNGVGLTNVTVSAAGNIVGTSSNVSLIAGSYTTTFDNTGNLTLPGNTFSVNYANNTPVNVVTKVESSWAVPVGNSTQSFTVPINNTYQLWVNCNIPNGIIVYNATVSVSNTNVPAIGYQYAWNYTGGGNILAFTSIPAQIIGTAGAISNASPAVANTNVFSFGIDNTSGNTVTVNYGWIQIS